MQENNHHKAHYTFTGVSIRVWLCDVAKRGVCIVITKDNSLFTCFLHGDKSDPALETTWKVNLFYFRYYSYCVPVRWLLWRLLKLFVLALVVMHVNGSISRGMHHVVEFGPG
jgi:hypothetical protein